MSPSENSAQPQDHCLPSRVCPGTRQVHGPVGEWDPTARSPFLPHVPQMCSCSQRGWDLLGLLILRRANPGPLPDCLTTGGHADRASEGPRGSPERDPGAARAPRGSRGNEGRRSSHPADTRVHLCAHTHTHTCSHVPVHTHTHTYSLSQPITHTQTHTHTRTLNAHAHSHKSH